MIRWILLAFLVPSGALAQAVTLDPYRMSETAEDGFALSRPTDRGDLRFGALLHLDYGYNPLVFEMMQGDASTESVQIVEHQLVANLALSLGLFDRLVVFAGVPINLLMMGAEEGSPEAMMAGGFFTDPAPNLGDVWLGARGRLFGEREDAFALALQFTATFPTAQAAQSSQRWSGDDGVTLLPELLLEVRFGDVVRVGGNFGARIRPTENGAFESSGGAVTLDVGHEFTWAAGVTFIPVQNVFEIAIEAYGTTSFESFGDREGTPVEALAGIRVFPVPGLLIGAAGGLGLQRGYGAADTRWVLSIGFADPVPEPVAELPPPPPAIGDRDHDGLLDNVDECPDEPEDMDDFEDENGCPDPDNDRDGILDDSDECRNDPEDIDQFEDENGCPDPDNDRDGILDDSDECRDDPEDIDTFEDQNGCPDPDNDQDTVLDTEDECPLVPGRPEDRGCPRTLRVEFETGRIIILQRVEFATNRDRILPTSEPVLEEVRAVLLANPGIVTVRVEGHTDDRGNDARNLDLSQRRAASVRRWLVNHGIDASRLRPFGCGETHPIETNRTAAGRQTNRRVEFLILDPRPEGAAPLLECTDANEVEPRDGETPPPRPRRRRAE